VPTVDLRPADEVAIAARFDTYRSRFVFHCDNLEHEDMAMVGNLEVR
jgi:spore coat protein A